MAKYIRKHPCGHQGRGKHCHRCEAADAIKTQLGSLTKESRATLGVVGVAQLEYEEARLRATRGSIPTWAEREKAREEARAAASSSAQAQAQAVEVSNG